MGDITARLAEFASHIDYAGLPSAVRERTRTLVADHFAIAYRARQEAALCPSLAAALRRLGFGGGVARVIGESGSYAPPAAAFFNGALAHCLDFDDTHARASIHPSAPILPAALAAAEMTRATGRDCIAAITAGYEIQIRLSLALGPSDHYARGYHPTATCGVFGAAAAAGRLFGLSSEGMARAFGLCGSQSAGSMQFLAGGAWNKPFHVGHAAMSGLLAATLAGEGFLGAQDAIEGKAGFLASYAPDPDPEKAARGLGAEWETLHIAIKPYPSCRYGHAAMDALIALRAESGLDPESIESVRIGLPRTGWRIIGDPEGEKQNPRNYVDAQFSMPFAASVALREGGMDWNSYAVHLDDPRTRALCRKVRSVVDSRVERLYPARMAGSALIRTRDAEEREKLVVSAKGEPDNFPGPTERRAKFDGLIGDYMSPAQREALAGALDAFDTLDYAGEALILGGAHRESTSPDREAAPRGAGRVPQPAAPLPRAAAYASRAVEGAGNCPPGTAERRAHGEDRDPRTAPLPRATGAVPGASLSVRGGAADT